MKTDYTAMKGKHIQSIIEGMTLDEFAEFYNKHSDPYSGLTFVKIYNAKDENDMDEFMTQLAAYMDYDIVKVANVMRDIYEDVKYIMFDEIDNKLTCLYNDNDINDKNLPMESLILTYEGMSYGELFGDVDSDSDDGEEC